MAEIRKRKPRADAQKNRELLLEAAKDVLGRGGPNASLEAVARRAGVGIGTLYRHFPTREELFMAVFSRELDQLIVTAEDLVERDAPSRPSAAGCTPMSIWWRPSAACWAR